MASGWTRLFAATTLIGAACTTYLLIDRPRACPIETAASGSSTPVVAADPWLDSTPRSAAIAIPTKARPEPELPSVKEESRMDRRARRTLEIAAFLGRQANETDDEYRARMVPLITAGLAQSREKATEMRKLAEQKAHVTPAQSAQLDKAFDKVYGDALDYTNKAIADGTLSPYERNVSGWLEIAGGMGTILGDAQGQVGKILDPAQMKTMYDAGFEWGEYLGVEAPWENLKPPPPPPKSP